jgi:hypothetical protein
VTVTNSGTTPLTISSIAASGDFSETDNCTKAALPATTTCVIQVTFTPTAAVASLGSITITDSGSGSPQEILVSGTGVLQPQATLSTASLGFPAQSIGSASSSQSVTLTNTGNASLTVSGIAITGDFTQANNCGSVLSPNSTCSMNVIFTPTVAGVRTGTLTITDNTGSVAGSTQTVQLSGVGQAVPLVSLSTTTLTFSGQTVGTTSAAQVVTLTNTGSAPLNITGVTSTGDFTQISTCPTSVAAGNSCTISVTFTPSTSGNRYGTITISDNALSSPQTITLSGVGNVTPASFQISLMTTSPAVPAGKTATFSLMVSSIGGFNQPVNLTCTPPATITCGFSSQSVTPTSSSPQTVTLTVSTQLRTIAPPGPRIEIDPFGGGRHFKGMWLAWLAVVLMLSTLGFIRRRPISATFGFAVILLLAMGACSGSGTAGVPVGTPAGAYTITVTGTSGAGPSAVTSSTQLPLQVN